MSAISLMPSSFLSSKENEQADVNLLKSLKAQDVNFQRYIETLQQRHRSETDDTALATIMQSIQKFDARSKKVQEKIEQVRARILKTHQLTKLHTVSPSDQYKRLKALNSKIAKMRTVCSNLEKTSGEHTRAALKLLKTLPDSVQKQLGKDVQKYHSSKNKSAVAGSEWGTKTLEKQPRLAVTLKNQHSQPLLQSYIQKTKVEIDTIKKELAGYFKEKASTFSKRVTSGKFSHEVLERLYESLEPEVQKLVSQKPPYYGSGLSKAAKQHETLGAHLQPDGSVIFRVFAPNAKAVSLALTSIGEEELEAPSSIQMKKDPVSGIWTTTVQELPEGSNYYYQITASSTKKAKPGDREAATKDKRIILNKVDPYGFGISKHLDDPMFYHSVVRKRPHDFQWKDDAWMLKRQNNDAKPMNIYEFHPALWRKKENEEPLKWNELAKQMVAHCKEFGFTHVEMMGALDYPANTQMACYQVLSFFASNHRLGTIEEMQKFVQYLHQHNIGILIDWVPAHFSIDSIGLQQFDGSTLYENRNFIEDDDKLHTFKFEKNWKTPILKKSRHPDWNTWEFDLSRQAPRNFLYASADFWLKVMHVDGMRVDAVTSMFFLDYSKKHKNIQWLQSKEGDNRNYDAMEFVRNLNSYVHQNFPGVQMIAEESSGAFPGLNDRIDQQRGYGFDKNWNMGWMNNTLNGFKQGSFNKIVHGFNITRKSPTVYEISHDEVAGDKGSILKKMPGSERERFAKSRNLLAYQMCLPGAKLGMMGNEFAQSRTWSSYPTEADLSKSKNKTKQSKRPIGVLWGEMSKPYHQGVANMMKRLGKLYLDEDALWLRDGKKDGTMHEIIDNENRVIAYRRKGSDPSKTLFCAHNFSSQALKKYRIPLPNDGSFSNLNQVREIFNSDDRAWSGQGLKTDKVRISHFEDEHYIEVTLPPNSTVIFEECYS